MYDFLLFVHVLAAFCLMVTVVTYSAYATGWATTPQGLTISNRLWDVGTLGTIIFGVWLALNRPEYDILDGWIIGAIVLWAVAAEAGRRAQEAFAGNGVLGSATAMHWLRVITTLAILVLMVWKPGV
jgi:hypothetical protein